MIQFFIDSFTRGYRLMSEHRTFVYTLALLILVPAAFLWSGDQFLRVAREYHARAENDRIGLLHDVFAAYLKETSGNLGGAGRVAQRIIAENPDFREFAIIYPSENAFTAESFMGHTLKADDYSNFLRASSVRDDESLVFEEYADTEASGTKSSVHLEHLRTGMRSVVLSGTTPSYYILTSFSLEAEDALYLNKIYELYAYLFGIVLIIMLLVIRQARIINYADLSQKLKDALDAKTTFINMTAHELRAPLTAMRGYASLLRENTELSDTVREQARRIEDSSLYMVSLISDLLDIAKMDAGNMHIEMHDLDIAEVITGIVGRLLPLAQERGLSLTAEKFPQERNIDADKKRLEEVLTNLISNSLKYTKEGGVAISTANVGGRLEIRIKDTGIGMTAENQDKLFTPFFRVEAEVGKTVGTGLGMWITKQFVERMGGQGFC